LGYLHILGLDSAGVMAETGDGVTHNGKGGIGSFIIGILLKREVIQSLQFSCKQIM